MRFALLSSLPILLLSCATTTTNYYAQTVQSWEGESAKALVKTWGRPDVVNTETNGNMVFAYRVQSYGNSTSAGGPAIGIHVSREGRAILTTTPNTTMGGHRGNNVTINCTAAFVVNHQGRIIDAQIKGYGCYGSESFSKRMTNPNSRNKVSTNHS